MSAARHFAAPPHARSHRAIPSVDSMLALPLPSPPACPVRHQTHRLLQRGRGKAKPLPCAYGVVGGRGAHKGARALDLGRAYACSRTTRVVGIPQRFSALLSDLSASDPTRSRVARLPTCSSLTLSLPSMHKEGSMERAEFTVHRVSYR